MQIFLRSRLLVKAWTLLGFIILGALPSYAQVHEDSLWSLPSIRTDLNADNELDYIGERVTVTGTANIGTGLLHEHYLQVFIQNDSSGLSLFKMNIDTPFQVGDSIVAQGTIDQYNGLAEVQVDAYRVLEGSQGAPAPKELSAAIEYPDQFLGMLVEGTARVIDKGSTFNGDYVRVKQENSTKNIMVYVSNFHSQHHDFNMKILREGDEVHVTGIVSEYNPDFPNERTYKLFLRTPDDLEYIGIPLYYRYMIFGGLGLIIIVIVSWILITRRQVDSKTTEIQASLNEKEVLLKEIHHRVKNSLAIVSSLLELQLYHTSSKDAHKALKDSQARIQSVALIHDKLYKTDSLSSVEMDVYVRELVETIHSTFTEYKDAVALHFDLEKVELNIDSVIPCGLLINELVVNAFKHAFQKDKQGKLEVTLKKKGKNILLQVADNGPGLPADQDLKKDDSLGSLLIGSFAEKLKADMDTLELEEGGVAFRFTFPQAE